MAQQMKFTSLKLGWGPKIRLGQKMHIPFEDSGVAAWAVMFIFRE
jgi:hypothetical protein